MPDLLAMMQVAAGGGTVEPGGLLVYSTGTKTGAASGFVSPYYDWVVPPNVRSICAVAIGGGGSGSGSIGGDGGSGGGAGALSYSNNITVTPGETLRIHAGLAGAASPENSVGYGGSASGIVRLSNSTEILKALAGGGSPRLSYQGGAGGSSAGGIGDVKYSGSAGGTSGPNYGGGGGGTAGYSADGSTGLGGSGFFGGNGDVFGLGGGGVGVYGEGASGTSGGQGGSGGTNGTTGSNGGTGGSYGAGGGGGDDESGALYFGGGRGANGAVRIIWGADREFPTTLTSLEDSLDNETTEII